MAGKERSSREDGSVKPKFEGYLSKQDAPNPNMLAFSSFKEPSWKRRYVLLVNEELRWYQVHASSTRLPPWSVFQSPNVQKIEKFSDLLGVVKLADTTVYHLKDDSLSRKKMKKENIFVIHTPESDLMFAAEDTRTQQQWILNIKTCQKNQSRNAEDTRSMTFAWEVPSKHLSKLTPDKKIGEGMFGEVFRGKFCGTDVAIKQLKVEGLKHGEVVDDLRKEAEILQQLRHPNVILYMGICLKPNVCIITEFASRGSLFDILYDHDLVVNYEKMMKIAWGIARGMNYLHSLDRKIIHRDLKSQNVLISEEWTVKICDFGLSHVRKRVETVTIKKLQNLLFMGKKTPGTVTGHYGVYGTPEWIAPEVLQSLPYNESIDVYSFGIVLCELLSRQLPYRDRYHITDNQDVIDCVLEGAIPTIPSWVDEPFRNVIEWCLDRNPTERPTFGMLTQFFEDVNKNKSSWLDQFDVPRLKGLLESTNVTANMLGCRELSEIIRDQGSPPKLDPAQLRSFLQFVLKYLECNNAHVHLDAIRALKSVSEHRSEPYRDELLAADTFAKVLKVIKSYEAFIHELEEQSEQNAKGISLCKDVLTESNAVLNNLVQTITAEMRTESFLNLQAVDRGSLDDLRKLQRVIQTRTGNVVKELRALELQQHLLSGLKNEIDGLEDHVAQVIEGADFIPNDEHDAKEVAYQNGGGGGAYGGDHSRGNSMPLSHRDVARQAIAPRSCRHGHVPMSSYASEHMQVPRQFQQYQDCGENVMCTRALGYSFEHKRWINRFLFLCGNELGVYESSQSSPTDPIESVNLYTSSYFRRDGPQHFPDRPQQPVAITKLGDFNGEKFCVSVKYDDDDLIFSFAVMSLQRTWVNAFNTCARTRMS